MKATGIVRNIDELGRIVIPKELRKKMNMMEGSPVEIFVDDGKIALVRYCENCDFCGSTENLTDVKGKKICNKCLNDIASMVN